MEVQYIKKWMRGTGKPPSPHIPERAKRLHALRRPYALIIQKDGKQSAFIELNNEFVYVGFLDEKDREVSGYEFSEIEPGKLFLKEIRQWTYQDDTFQQLSSKTFTFTIDGDSDSYQIRVRKRDHKTSQGEKLYLDDKFPLSEAFYEAYPEFGEYNNLLKQREIPELDSL